MATPDNKPASVDLPTNEPDRIIELLAKAKDPASIKALQEALTANGQNKALAKALKNGDGGHFGPLTKQALQKYLAASPLNDASKATLLEATNKALKDLSSCTGDRRSACIFTIQAANDLVIDPKNPIGMDGIYGPKTKTLIESGEFGGRVLHQLAQMNGASATAAPQATTVAPPNAPAANDPARPVETEETHPAVRNAKKAEVKNDPAAATETRGKSQETPTSLRAMRENGPATTPPPEPKPAAAAPPPAQQSSLIPPKAFF